MSHANNVPPGRFVAEAEKLRNWLFEAAFPLWWRVGADRSLGGYHERIDFAGRPAALPRRSRVAARQAFCYSEAGRLGWNGPWRDAARHALLFLHERFAQADGTVVSAIARDGSVIEPGFDLYDQAFALLAYACGHRNIEPEGDWQSRAYALRDTLKSKFAHPSGGFREDRDGRLPLRSNPHMHLLEAALAWVVIDRGSEWRRMADEIVTLCEERFIDPDTGGLREIFAPDWAPADGIEGDVVEPGHHYEWAWLLDQWAKLTGRVRPSTVSRLVAFADTKGIDRNRGVAINRIRLDGSVHDAVARLWPQTERMRAYLIDFQDDDGVKLGNAIDSLWR
jgi:mannose/cellobiose epimerase-like protein (N-acyl-D-glucosamine 2-epimerase family)